MTLVEGPRPRPNELNPNSEPNAEEPNAAEPNAEPDADTGPVVNGVAGGDHRQPAPASIICGKSGSRLTDPADGAVVGRTIATGTHIKFLPMFGKLSPVGGRG
jgi:hypothetical protein